MTYMPWDDSLLVGNEMIDDDHRTLVQCLNDLFDASDDDAQAIGNVMDTLGIYTAEHFAREESLMAETSYGDATNHKKEHALLLKLYVDNRNAYRAGQATRLDLVKFLRMWLMGHIKNTDTKLASHVRSLVKAEPAAAAPRPAVKVDWTKISVGVVDDSVEIRRTLRTILRGFGASHVVEASDGAHFLQEVNILRTAVDIVFSDDGMSPLDGIEMMRMLRGASDSPCPQAVGILIPADGSVGKIKAALEAGYHGVVAKPFSANAIRQQAERFLGNPLPWERVNGAWRPIRAKPVDAKARPGEFRR
ncbi:MAG: bacteriohemerythrin [Alphaproteobacteria bacterium]|nr:bacteriohemerythrin [Alphaproteobacteria bacterium]